MLTKPYIIMLASYAILKVTAKVWSYTLINFLAKIHLIILLRYDYSIKLNISQSLYPVLYPDFCSKISIEYPSSPVNVRAGGFFVFSDLYSENWPELLFLKIF